MRKDESWERKGLVSYLAKYTKDLSNPASGGGAAAGADAKRARHA